MKLTDQQPPYKCLVNWQFNARASKATSSSFMPPLVPSIILAKWWRFSCYTPPALRATH